MGGTTALTGQNLYDMVTQLNGGYQMNQTLFYQLLSIAKNLVEGKRDWYILKAQDQSLTSNQSDTFKTAYSLAGLTRQFMRTQEENPVVLVDPNNSSDFLLLDEVPFQDQYYSQYDPQKCCIDYVGNNLYILGNRDKTRTILLNFIYDTPDIAAGTTWVFPAKYHPILAFIVSAIWKGGIDYDDVNARMKVFNDETVKGVYEQMEDWDANIQVNSLKGRDRGFSGGQSTYMSGRIDTNG